MHNLWRWFKPFSFLECTIIKFICFTESQSAAKGVEVTQQRTSLALPMSFYHLHSNSSDMSGKQWAARWDRLLPHTCRSEDAVCFTPERDWAIWVHLVWTGEWGLESECLWYLFDLELAQDAAGNGAKDLLTSHHGSHKHGLLGWPSNFLLGTFFCYIFILWLYQFV